MKGGLLSWISILHEVRVIPRYQLENRLKRTANISTRMLWSSSGQRSIIFEHLRPEEDHSIWSKCRQGISIRFKLVSENHPNCNNTLLSSDSYLNTSLQKTRFTLADVLIRCSDLPQGKSRSKCEHSSLYRHVTLHWVSPEAVQVIHDWLQDDQTLRDRTTLSPGRAAELLQVCLRSTYFSYDEGFYEQLQVQQWVPLSPLQWPTSTWKFLKSWH